MSLIHGQKGKPQVDIEISGPVYRSYPFLPSALTKTHAILNAFLWTTVNVWKAKFKKLAPPISTLIPLRFHPGQCLDWNGLEQVGLYKLKDFYANSNPP